MKLLKTLRILTLLASPILFAPLGFAQQLATPTPQRLLVKYRPASLALSVGERSTLQKEGIAVIPVSPFTIEDARTQFEARKDVEWVEVDRLVYPVQYPNDPRFPEQWALARMGNSALWFPGSPDAYRGSPDITIANLDTGVFTAHPDLAANVVPGWNIPGNNSDTSDINGHGTMTAGCMVATSNNALGIAAPNWFTRFMPIRISNNTNGGAYLSDIGRGILWAKDHGVRVVSISYSVYGSVTVEACARSMKEAGGLVFSAAGNGGSQYIGEQTPWQVVVSGTDQNDNRWAGTTYGNMVDVSAPATGVLTLNRAGGYSFGSGTSFASPTAAGLAAIIWSINDTLTPDEVENIIKATALDLGPVGWDNQFGWGRVDYQAAALATPADLIPPTVQIIYPSDGFYIEFRGGQVPRLIYKLVVATAQDNVGVARVEFYVDGALVATDTVPDYASRVPLPGYELGTPKSWQVKAVAYDAAGNSAEHTITVNYRPSN